MNNKTKTSDIVKVSKEMLAKLLSMENISVEHRQVKTAMFNIKDRVLILPTFNDDISPVLYSFLICHEVGHALFTTKEEFLKKIVDAKDFRLKSAFNIVEDVRIEKMVQKKYQGTKRYFREGYKDLMDRDFFGLQEKNKPLEEYNLADRINLHFKAGLNTNLDVPFKDEEQIWLDKIDACETIYDAFRVAEELVEHMEKTEENDPELQFDEVYELIDEDSEGDGEGEGQEGDGKDGNKKKKLILKEGDEEGKENKKKALLIHRKKFGTKFTPDNFSETENSYAKKMESIIDVWSNGPTYVNLPTKFDLDNIIVPYKKVHEQIFSHYEKYPKELDEAAADVAAFKAENKPVVSHMAQIFHMKKSAIAYARRRTANTGVLNMNKMQDYKFSDDLFKKSVVIQKGKSHGLVIFMDLSGSMSDHMQGTLEQLLNLAMFCTKISIPYRVYGFTDINAGIRYSYNNKNRFRKSNGNDLLVSREFSLREYFSSDMTTPEFNAAMKNMMAVVSYYKKRANKTLPDTESLGGTPLNQTVMVATEIVRNFREKYKLDLVNTVFLTDGEATDCLMYNGDENYSRVASKKLIIKSKITRKSYEEDISVEGAFGGYGGTQTRMLLNILREVGGVKVIGFYICNSDVGIWGEHQAKIRNLKEGNNIQTFYNKHGFIEMTEAGYDAYYVVPGGKELSTKVGSFEPGSPDTHKIKTEFANFMSMRQKKRVMLTRFIEQIA